MAPRTNRSKTAAADVPVPQSRAEAEEFVANIGGAQRELVLIEAAMNEELAEIKRRHEERAAPHKAAITTLTEGVRMWAAANRSGLTDGGRTKTVALTTGFLKWRLTPPAVKVKRALLPEIFAALRARGLGDALIRVSEEINREAILASPERVEGIDGLTVTQAEEFVIEPHADELAPA